MARLSINPIGGMGKVTQGVFGSHRFNEHESYVGRCRSCFAGGRHDAGFKNRLHVRSFPQLNSLLSFGVYFQGLSSPFRFIFYSTQLGILVAQNQILAHQQLLLGRQLLVMSQAGGVAANTSTAMLYAAYLVLRCHL